MNVNIKQAVKLFFANPSLEMIYFEAIANSLDAEATEINIEIFIEEFSREDTLRVKITDNGAGFTEDRFAKFKELLKVDEESHKGVGRLVFLSYFKNVSIISQYGRTERTIQFNENFDGKSSVVNVSNPKQKTTITFNNYNRSKIASHEYLKPGSIIKRIKEQFYPRLYLLKKNNKDAIISVTLEVNKSEEKFDFQPETIYLKASDFPDLKVEKINVDVVEMFQKADLHYSITKSEGEKTVITALCVDGRSYKQEIISDENIPYGYELIFLLYSDLFIGQVDPSRQILTLKESVFKTITLLFRNKVTEILRVAIPEIIVRNEKTKEDIVNRYPHLLDYIETDTIGFIKREDTIRKAQEQFFKDQKEILEAPNSMSDDIYEKTLEVSARLLTEYILYRQIIINRLKKINRINNEDDIHKLIVPPRKIYTQSEFISDIFTNNVWLLDDKYMTYNTILSDKVMTELIKEITKEENVPQDNSEPDIAIIFSNDPELTPKVDVVIVELKKKEASINENITAITQLQTRATKLMHLFPNKIQRIWFYAVVDITPSFQLYLENNRFKKLYSSGSAYYREDEIKIHVESNEWFLIGINILDYSAFVDDADMRNSAFLKILKENFRKKG